MTELVNTRIVVADDDEDVLDLVVFKLSRAGFDTIAVFDGLAALEAIRSDPPSLAILDIMMPGMSGLDVTRQVKSIETTKDVAVILLTSRAGDVDVDAGLAVGARDYVIKPFSPSELLDRVNRVLVDGESGMPDKLEPAGWRMARTREPYGAIANRLSS